MKRKPMTRNDAARIQSATCQANDGTTPKDSFAARAMSAAYRNEPLIQTHKGRNNFENKNNIGLFAIAAGLAAAGYYLYQSVIKTQTTEIEDHKYSTDFRTDARTNYDNFTHRSNVSTTHTDSGNNACKIGLFAIASAGAAITAYYAYQSLNFSN